VSAPAAVYSDVIRARWRRPRYRGELPGATAVAEDVNPLCGDRVRLALQEADGTIAAARFTGDSCAICTASADVLAETVEGRSRGGAAAVTAGDLLAALQADIRPTRMRCVTLPLAVLAAALGNGERSHIAPGAGHPRPEPASRPPLQQSHPAPETGHPRPEPASRPPLS